MIQRTITQLSGKPPRPIGFKVVTVPMHLSPLDCKVGDGITAEAFKGFTGFDTNKRVATLRLAVGTMIFMLTKCQRVLGDSRLLHVNVWLRAQ